MSKISLPPMELIYRDLFVVQTLYRMTRLWLIENQYVDMKGDSTMESAMEVLYMMKQGSHSNPNENELRIWWRTKKSGINESTSGSKYFVHRMDIDFWIIKMVDREVMVEGRKVKAQYGELRISLKPSIDVVDFKNTPIVGWFDKWIKERLIKKNLEENRKMLYQDTYRLNGTLKKYLELKSWLPAEETFHEKFDFI